MMKVTKANFEQEVLNAKTPVLVDFFANWCMPCKMFAPVLDEVAESYANRLKIVKVDIDEAVELAQKYRDMGCNVLWTGSDKDFYMRGYNTEMDVLKNIK